MSADNPDERKAKTRKKTAYAVCLGVVVAAVWNFVPLWFVGNSITEAWRALWIWGVFPMSIPIFYAFIDRCLKRWRDARDIPRDS